MLHVHTDVCPVRTQAYSCTARNRGEVMRAYRRKPESTSIARIREARQVMKRYRCNSNESRPGGYSQWHNVYALACHARSAREWDREAPGKPASLPVVYAEPASPAYGNRGVGSSNGFKPAFPPVQVRPPGAARVQVHQKWCTVTGVQVTHSASAS
jgi:hypothetical protein